MGKNNNRLIYINEQGFEVIEAKRIFDISFNKIKILINPNSYSYNINL